MARAARQRTGIDMTGSVCTADIQQDAISKHHTWQHEQSMLAATNEHNELYVARMPMQGAGSKRGEQPPSCACQFCQ